MNRNEFIKTFNEYPEDVLGNDYEDILKDELKEMSKMDLQDNLKERE